MTLPLQQGYAKNTAILAYSLNNKKYERNIRKVLERVRNDKNIVSVHICLACTLQRWNKRMEGYTPEEAIAISRQDGDTAQIQIDNYAKTLLGEKYKGIFRWYDYTSHPNYPGVREQFDQLCSKQTTLRILHDMIKNSNREDLLRQEGNITEIFNNLLRKQSWAAIPWETAMAASIFAYTVAALKKYSPDKHPIIYENRQFAELLDLMFNNSYEYLAEESVIAYNFWDYNRLLYFGKITPALSKAYEEFVVKEGQQSRLWWQDMEAEDGSNTNQIKDYIESYLKNQKIQVKKDCLAEFTNTITMLLKLIEGTTSKEIKYLLKLLATSILSANNLDSDH